LFLFISCHVAVAQEIISQNPSQIEEQKLIQIINAKDLRQVYFNDTTQFQTLAGNAIVRQGTTILSGDSIAINKISGIVEVFGNVHINDNNKINTYSQYVKYIGAEQVAYLKNKVKLTDGKSELYTNDLTYDVKTGIAVYTNGGKVINGKTILTSENATYNSYSKDVNFNSKVHLVDPKYDMTSESLRYNTISQNAYFTTATHIKSEKGIIETKNGNYNIGSGSASFLDQPTFTSRDKFITGQEVLFDDKKNTIEIKNNGKIIDTTQKLIVNGSHILIDNKNNTFLATEKPVMVFYDKIDSTFITADTLFYSKTPPLKTSESKDSISVFNAYHNVRIFNDSIQAVCDSMFVFSVDSTLRLMGNPICWNGNNQITGDTIILFSKNQQPQKISVYYNAILINKTDEGYYNQIGGRTMNGFFTNGQIEYIRTKGTPAESIFYPQDEKKLYTGMNRNKGDVIDIIFLKEEITKIKFVNDVTGTLYPLQQIPKELNKLKNFNWQITKRPLNKFEFYRYNNTMQ